METIRPDCVFSYWIFIWYLLYLFKVVKGYNPKFAIIVGFLENLSIILLMFYYKTKPKFVFLFIVMFLFMKVIPLYTVWNSKIKLKDVILTLVLFLIYLVWIYLNGKRLTELKKDTFDLIIHNKSTFPGITLLNKLF